MWEKLCLELSRFRSRGRWKRGGKRENGKKSPKGEAKEGNLTAKCYPLKKAMVSGRIGCAGWAEKKYVSKCKLIVGKSCQNSKIGN